MLNFGYLLYLFVLIFAPVALGATHIGAKMTVELAVFMALFCVLFDGWRSGRPLRKAPALWPAIGFVLWIAIQLIPMPSGLLSWVSPAAHEIYATVYGPDVTSFWAPITVKPQYTVQTLFEYAAFVAYYFLSVQLLAERQRLRQVLTLVLSVAGLLAFLGILQFFAGNGKIFWIFDPGPNIFFGSFYYRNHFAGFMAMLLPLALALFLYHRPHAGSGIPFREQITHVIDQLKHSPLFRYGLIAIFFFAAILLSQSRTGISVAVLTTGGMLIGSRKLLRLQRTSPAFLALFVLVILVIIGKSGLDTIDTRFGDVVSLEGLSNTGKSVSGRMSIWSDCLLILKDFPITGSGFGSFFAIFPSYNHTQTHIPRQAHNEYLETAVDGGLLAIALVGVFLVLYFRQNFVLYRHRHDTYARYLFVGSLTGIVALLLHCFTEYQFRQTAAIPLYFFFILGVLTVGIHSRRGNGTRSNLLPDLPIPKRILGILCCCALFLVPVDILFHAAEIAARSVSAIPENKEKALLNLSPEYERESLLHLNRKALRAAGYDRYNPIYPTAVAFTAEFLGNADLADQYYRRALLLDPTNANTLQLYGEFLSGQDRLDDAHRLLKASVARDRNSAQRLLVYVLWLLGQQESDMGIQEAKTMLEQHPQLAPSFFAILDESPLPAEILPQTLPERVEPYLAYAALLEKKGQLEGVATTYDLALSFLEREEIAKPNYFTQPLAFFRKQKDEERILAILKMATTRLPNEFSFHLQLGDAYLRQGMQRKAAEEFRMALQIKPGDKQVQQRLENVMVVE